MTFLFFLLFAGIGCDQVTKSIATDTLVGEPPKAFLYGTVQLVYAENSGAFLGLGGNLPEGIRFLLLTVLNGVVIAGVFVFLLARWRMPRAQFAGLALVVAGGVGNMIDRVVNDGRVTDFLVLGVGPVRTGIFNVADVAIVLAGVLLVFGRRERPEPDPGT